MRRIVSSAFALATLSFALPAAAQDARSCVNEVQRLHEAFPLTPSQRETVGAEPSARRGASLSEEQRKAIARLIEDARAAGERGEGEVCARHLGEARAQLRRAGVGSPQPGSGVGSGSTVGDTTRSSGSAGSRPPAGGPIAPDSSGAARAPEAGGGSLAPARPGIDTTTPPGGSGGPVGGTTTPGGSTIGGPAGGSATGGGATGGSTTGGSSSGGSSR